MCNPAAVAIAFTVGAGLFQAKTQRDAGKYEAQVAEQNAKISGIQAEQAKQTGNIEEERARVRVRQMLGAQRVAFAANNVDMGTGSALNIMGDTAGFGFSDASQIRSNALREAWGYNVSQTNEQSRGRAARYAGRTGAIGTLLTTGASAAGQWKQAGYGKG